MTDFYYKYQKLFQDNNVLILNIYLCMQDLPYGTSSQAMDSIIE